MAFAAADAPAAVFALRLPSQACLVVSREVADALDVDSLGDVHLSAFHLTPGKGGARPAMAALGRLRVALLLFDGHRKR